MSPAEAATSLGRVAVTLRRGSAGHHARPVVLAVAGVVGAARVATGGDRARRVALPLGLGLAFVWAARRGGARAAPAQHGLEAELRTHARELRDSRARLTHVADAERRRIERDLHDGCQQRLICLRMKLALAEQLVGDENDSAVKLIHEITDDAKFALEDLEALVHGMYPAILVDRGLAAAFTEIGRSAPMPVRVLVEATPRYPAEVEAAVYFACAEALQNAAKHAGGTATARIALRHGGSGLAFEVRDDGGGFADAVNGGSGLANMQDRLSSVGGQLRITSEPGCGTTVQGWVVGVEPLHAQRESPA